MSISISSAFCLLVCHKKLSLSLSSTLVADQSLHHQHFGHHHVVNRLEVTPDLLFSLILFCFLLHCLCSSVSCIFRPQQTGLGSANEDGICLCTSHVLPCSRSPVLSNLSPALLCMLGNCGSLNCSESACSLVFL